MKCKTDAHCLNIILISECFKTCLILIIILNELKSYKKYTQWQDR